MCEGFLRSPALVSHTSATGSAGLCGLWRGSVLADTSPAAQVLKGWQTKKQTKSCTPEGTANKPLLNNGSLHPPNARGGHLCVICGQVFWLKRQTSFPAFPGTSPSDILGKHSANTATALRGIHTRFPIVRPGGRTHIPFYSLDGQRFYYKVPGFHCQAGFACFIRIFAGSPAPPSGRGGTAPA